MQKGFKKILFSLGFVVFLGIYVIYQRSGNNSNPVATNLQTSSTSATILTPTQIKFKDGQYTGSSADAFYGMVQVQAIVSGGKLNDIKFLSYPKDNGSSLSRSNSALPQLKSEAIKAQSANVDAISGATETSAAFNESLSSALSQAS